MVGRVGEDHPRHGRRGRAHMEAENPAANGVVGHSEAWMILSALRRCPR